MTVARVVGARCPDLVGQRLVATVLLSVIVHGLSPNPMVAALRTRTGSAAEGERQSSA
jgi:hypothetical protein